LEKRKKSDGYLGEQSRVSGIGIKKTCRGVPRAASEGDCNDNPLLSTRESLTIKPIQSGIRESGRRITRSGLKDGEIFIMGHTF